MMAGQRLLVTLALAAIAGGCQIVSDLPKKAMVQDVEFLRGCWVAKGGPNGPVTAFLRLLPEGAEGLAYQGYLHAVTSNEMKPQLYLSFTRDGATMTMRQANGRPGDADGTVRAYALLPPRLAALLPPVRHRAGYATNAGDPASPWFIAEGDGDTLKVYPISGAGQEMRAVFNGERDGCD
jgi:hypothetical protein